MAESENPSVRNSIRNSILQLESQVHEIRNKLARLRAENPRTLVKKTYSFQVSGRKTVPFSDLFGHHSELFVIHNMGESCPYCTMWADGFNGMLPHLESRCSVVVISDDPPEVQKDFAEARRWKLRMASSNETSFKEDFGFREDGLLVPGASTFFKDEKGQIFHCNDTRFGPGDPFCSTWFIMDMLPEGEDNWRPKMNY